MASITAFSSDAKALKNPRSTSLSKRECDVCDLVTQALRNKQIARQLGIRLRTVHAHRYKLYRKLGVHNSAQLMRRVLAERSA
jgi:DNA-binding NarL/FixJ family response regulator